MSELLCLWLCNIYGNKNVSVVSNRTINLQIGIVGVLFDLYDEYLVIWPTGTFSNRYYYNDPMFFDSVQIFIDDILGVYDV